MSADKLLLEIGTEEIPSSCIPEVLIQLKAIADDKLKNFGVDSESIKVYATPRRMVVLTTAGLIQKTLVSVSKVTGPPKKAAIGKDGKPTKAGAGFAKKFGRPFEDVKIEDTPKGEYLYLEIEKGGRDAAEVLREVLPEIISDITFPKTMRWGSGDVRFVRPIRYILALLGSRTIDFSMGGLRSGKKKKTLGHRFLSNGELTVNDPDSYEEVLKNACVIVDPVKRSGIINEALDEIEKEHKVKVIRDEELLETICHLTEYPVPVAGSFNEDYLDLPRELLITVMKHHQKYFSVETKDGDITNGFVAFSNMSCGDMPVVRKGYERVLTARLADARFFFDEDRKHTLDHFAQKLSGVVYIKGLGSIADKTRRLGEIAQKIAEAICPQKVLQVKETAALCKADLTTSMVYEFPELQGIMGREYARAQGLDDEVAAAIDEHYRPRFSGDELPSTDVGRAVALADKIDAICCCFALKLIPTGSEDPFSLRRHALGIIRILLEESPEEKISPVKMAKWWRASLPVKMADVRDRDPLLHEKVKNFIDGRLKSEFMAQGLPYDVIEAIFAAGFDSLPDALKRCEALAEMKKESYCENLSVSFKRAASIVKDYHSMEVDESLFSEKAEKELLDTLRKRKENVELLVERGDYAGALKEIAGIRTAVDNFFDAVFVMTDDVKIRNNRLGLLKLVVSLFEGLADFSKLVYEGE